MAGAISQPPAELSIPVLLDEKPTVVPVGSAGEQSGGATRAPPRAFSASQDGQFLSHPHCGFIGCVDLRPWAKANRYRYRLEESYQAENNAHVKGDGRWFVEIVCQRGLIYPAGGLDLAAFTKSVHAWRELLEVEGISKPQEASGEWRCRFPL